MQSNELTPKQQAVELLKQAESVLLVTGRQPSVDQIMAVFAMQEVLLKLGKKCHSVVTDEMPQAAKVVNLSKISKTIDGVRDFIISLDLKAVEVEKLKYEIEDQRLNITITPHAGNFTADDARYEYGNFQFDLVVVLGVHSISKMDVLLEQNPTLFDGLHLINYDFHRVNDQYGSVNFIDTAATSVSEMFASTIESLGSGLLDVEIATALLTGIMSATNRFRTAATSA
ncbi:MAG: DHH family phosphoesterase, partial [bacterium]